MLRLLAAASLLGWLLLVVTESQAGEKPRRDPEAIFKKLDANGDGKLSKDEFTKLTEFSGGRFKDKPELLDKLFARLDANSDGSISLEEFKKFGERKPKP